MSKAPAVPIYWDSCVIIDFLQQDASRYPTLRSIVEEARAGKIILVTSALAVAEVVKLGCSGGSAAVQQAMIQGFFDYEFVEVRDVNRDIAERAASICRQHSIKPADAIHVATAEKVGSRCLQTYDGLNKDQTVKRRCLLEMDGKIGTPPLHIAVPAPLFPTPLFDSLGECSGTTPQRQRCAIHFPWRRPSIHPLRMRSPLDGRPSDLLSRASLAFRRP